MAGDFEMWHRLALKYPVVLMPHGIIWYRKHENQEMNNYADFIHIYDEVQEKYLSSDEVPLSKIQLNEILIKIKKDKRRQKFKSFLSSISKRF